MFVLTCEVWNPYSKRNCTWKLEEEGLNKWFTLHSFRNIYATIQIQDDTNILVISHPLVPTTIEFTDSMAEHLT